MGITLLQFKTMCQNRQRYTGYVEGLGYVCWRPRYVIYDRQDMSYNKPSGSEKVAFYELVIIKNEENTQSGFSPLREVKDMAINALSVYGAINSVEQLSTKPVVLGPDYIQINRQGTLVRNRNKKYTTKGKIAGRIGDKLFGIGVIIDLALWQAGEQEWYQTKVNIGVNTGIFLIGQVCPPAGVVLGILWFILNAVHTDPRPSPGTYEQIHGSIAPADATKVHNPYYDNRIIPRKYVPSQYNFEQK